MGHPRHRDTSGSLTLYFTAGIKYEIPQALPASPGDFAGLLATHNLMESIPRVAFRESTTSRASLTMRR